MQRRRNAEIGHDGRGSRIELDRDSTIVGEAPPGRIGASGRNGAKSGGNRSGSLTGKRSAAESERAQASKRERTSASQ
jgi:hypothetical protein